MMEFLTTFFLNPWGLLGLLAIPLVVLIYLLRSRYKTKSVSSTFIWKRSLKYVKRRIPLNFIMSLILILQILIVIAASFAIARPTIEPMETGEKIIILDASASMQTKQGEKTRFEAAKDAIEKAADDIGPNSKFTLILAGEEPITIVTRTMDKGDFLTKLKPVECTMKGANMEKALEVAGQILNENAGATIQIYTDKDYIDTGSVEIVDCKREGEWNSSIISLEENELFTGKEFIVNVGNYGVTSAYSVKLLINGEVKGQTLITMEPDETKQIRFTHSKVEDDKLNEEKVLLSAPITSYETATITLSSADNFNFDDTMTIYPKEKAQPKIAYISKYVTWESGRKNADKSFLYFAIKSAGHTIDSYDMFDNADDAANLSGYDLYIFEGITPNILPTDGAVWLLDAKSAFKDDTGITIGTAARDNENGYRILTSVSSDAISGIIKNVDLDTPLIYEGEKRYAAVSTYRPIVEMGQSFKSVYEVDGQPIMIAGNYNGARMIVSTFDVLNSSLIAFVTDFPTLVNNMIEFSIPDILPDRTAPIGTKITFDFPAGSKLVERYFNDELVDSVDILLLMTELQEQLAKDPDFDINSALNSTFEIDMPGKYEIVVTYPDGDDKDLQDDKKSFFVTGYMPNSEAAIVKRVATESLEAPQPADGASIDYEREEIFPYVIAVLIVLLIIEWGVYYREQY